MQDDNGVPERPRTIRASHIDLGRQPHADTPSQRIVAGANPPPVVEVDGMGRTLRIRKIGMVDQMRIRRVLGAELSKNESYLALATLAFCVTEIDGETVIPPATVREAEALVGKLGEDGAIAIGKAYAEQGWAKIEDQQGFDLEAAKN